MKSLISLIFTYTHINTIVTSITLKIFKFRSPNIGNL